MDESGPRPETLSQRAWNHYRRGEYQEAFNLAQELGENIQGLEIFCHLYAYSPKHRDRTQIDPNNPNSAVSKLKKLDPENIRADNAVVVYEIERRRQGGEPVVDEEWVRSALERHENRKDSPDLVANILQNAARYLAYFGERSETNKGQAFSWLDRAIMLYDPRGQHASLVSETQRELRADLAAVIPNLHHIAGAFYRRSEAYVEFGDPDDLSKAIAEARIAETLWQAIADSSDNPRHQESLRKAIAWREELEKKA